MREYALSFRYSSGMLIWVMEMMLNHTNLYRRDTIFRLSVTTHIDIKVASRTHLSSILASEIFDYVIAECPHA